MKKILIALFLLLPSLAYGQGTGRVVASCGTLPQAYVAGSTRDIVQDVNGNLCTNGGVSGTLTVQQVAPEPCQNNAKTYTPISVAASGTLSTPIAAGTAAKKTYICQLILNNNAADNVAVVEATTGTSCGTVTAGIFGGTTTGTGFQFSANGGVSLGNGGFFVGKTATNNDDICLITSASTQLTGGITWVQQ